MREAISAVTDDVLPRAIERLAAAADAEAVLAIVRDAARMLDDRDTNIRLASDEGSLVWPVAATGDLHARVRDVLEPAANVALAQLAARRELEARLRRQARRLDASSREIDRFASALAHDLQSPICAIGLATQTFVGGLGQRDARAERFLTGVTDLATRMSALVTDLQMLAGLSRAPIRPSPLDLGTLARDGLDLLRKGDPGRAVTTVVPDGLTAVADATLVRLALDHLLSNAWKFSSARSPARIEIGRTDERDGLRTFFVRDNGVGFDGQRADRLFVPYSRLHAPAAFEGRGLGLAVVQRVIHRHGGQVWAEAIVDRGATFFLTLPLTVEGADLTSSG